ncbi:MAG: plastocyanin/azurin family copper-binding protein [Gaiellaceae bacterium]
MRRVLVGLLALCCGLAAVAPGALADKQVGAQPVDSYSGDVTMSQGETLTFQNLDLQNHDVTANDKGADGKPLFASPTIGFGQNAKVEGAQKLGPGTYKFYCSVHPFMTATLTVTGNGTPPSSPPPSESTQSSQSSAPSVSVALGNAKLSKVRKSRKLPVKVTVSKASTVTLTAAVGKKAIAAGKAILSAGGSTTMNLSLSPAGRKALKHKRSVKVQLKAVANDAGGNKGAAATTAKLRG